MKKVKNVSYFRSGTVEFNQIAKFFNLPMLLSAYSEHRAQAEWETVRVKARSRRLNVASHERTQFLCPSCCSNSANCNAISKLAVRPKATPLRFTSMTLCEI